AGPVQPTPHPFTEGAATRNRRGIPRTRRACHRPLSGLHKQRQLPQTPVSKVAFRPPSATHATRRKRSRVSPHLPWRTRRGRRERRTPPRASSTPLNSCTNLPHPKCTRQGRDVATLFRLNRSRSALLDLGEPELVGETVAFGETAQLVPGGVLDFDAVGTALLFPHVLDFARIINAAAAFGRPCRLQILCKLADVLLELIERPEGVDLEYRHETPVIVAAGRLDPEAEPGQEAAENFDHHRQAITFVALAAA